ncbi:hypothetical protein HDEF_0570 [Candidatus Hamiltonella defensa 5AT (Acyrthosiphon pisum)]|uniref:Uncharacterized protein n=2 Tax=Candidatus Williamhamiltonella defendens TaxID=138072 RepID=C4K423_HAMD5|nr:hypothetical protein HDEF_0570 [Candidatus Hamiltonella defensa 5AT (Acyrthosiphon pisum)]
MTINTSHCSTQMPSMNDWSDLSATESSISTGCRQPPSPQESGFCSWVRNLLNYLTGTFGEKLSCSKLNSALNDIFSPENGWVHKGHFEYGGTNQVGYRSKQIEGVIYIVSAPCHDLSNPDTQQHVLSGGRNAAQMLSEIKNTYPNDEVKILIPVAQSNKFGFSEKRGHFVLLEVDMQEGKCQSAKIHDSKGGLLDTVYRGAKHLKKQLLADKNLSLTKNFAINTEYHGHQSVFNGNDCGRYSAYYANKIIEKRNLSEATDARPFFEKHL